MTTKRLLLLFFAVTILTACTYETLPKTDKVLTYAIHYPDSKVVHEYKFKGDNTAQTFIHIDKRKRVAVYELYLSTGKPYYPMPILETTCPVDIIGISNAPTDSIVTVPYIKHDSIRIIPIKN